jgi:hypothetical protein
LNLLIKIINFDFFESDFDFIELDSTFEGNKEQVLDILENLNIGLSNCDSDYLTLKNLHLDGVFLGGEPIAYRSAIPDINQVQIPEPTSSPSFLPHFGLQLVRELGLLAERQKRTRLVDFEIRLVGGKSAHVRTGQERQNIRVDLIGDRKVDTV